MKRRHAVLLGVLAATGLLGSIGCDKAAPTEPERVLAEARSDAALPAVQVLAGRWEGTITFHAFGYDHGLSCDGPAPMSVVLGQDGTLLSGRFRAACAGELEIRGVIAGSGLSGSMDVVGRTSLGWISGSVSSSRIAFKTRITMNDETHKGEPPVVSSEVEMHRALAVRTSPALAGGRPSHSIAVSR